MTLTRRWKSQNVFRDFRAVSSNGYDGPPCPSNTRMLPTIDGFGEPSYESRNTITCLGMSIGSSGSKPRLRHLVYAFRNRGLFPRC